MREQTAPIWAARWRWLGLAGVALAFYAAWAPWAIGISIGPINGHHPAPACSYLPNLSPSSLSCYTAELSANPLFDPALFAWLTPLGLLLVALLWSRRFRPLAAGLLALWWLFMSAALLVAAATVVPLLAQGQAQVILTNTTLRLGAFAALAGLAVGWLAELRLLRDALRQQRLDGWSSILPRTPPRAIPANASSGALARAGLLKGGAGAVTAGVLLWGVSILMLPWALGTCPESIPVGTACPGLSAASAMVAAALPAVAWINPDVFQFAVPVLLVGGGVLAMFAAWRLSVNGRLCGWLAAWLALATTATALGIAGAASVIAGTSALTLDHPTAYSGYFLGEIGLAVAWLGLVPLLVASLGKPALVADP